MTHKQFSSKGGATRAKRLTAEARKAIARAGGLALAAKKKEVNK